MSAPVNYPEGEPWEDDFDDDDDCCPECHGEGFVEYWVDDSTRDEDVCGLCKGSGHYSGTPEAL